MYNFLNPIRRLRTRWRSFWAVNWLKTYYFNYKMFTRDTARKLPVFIYGSVKFANLSGKVVLGNDIHKKMIRIGFNYEKDTTSRKPIELHIAGIFEFKGYAQIAKDCFIYVGKDGHCTLGDMVGIASRSKLMCIESITIGDWTRISAESQLYDSDFHEFANSETQEIYPMTGPVILGSHNFIGYRSSIKKNTITPNYCTIASNTLCSSNYLELGEYILLGGVPAKKLKDNFTRLWVKEKEQLKSTFGYINI